MIRKFIHSIYRDGTRILLTQCLLVVSFVLALITLTDSYSYLVQKKENEKLYAYDTDKIYRVDVMHVNENDFNQVGFGINQIKEGLKQELNIDVGAYYETTADFSELYSNAEYINRNKYLWAGEIDEQWSYLAKVFFVDPQLTSIIRSELDELSLQPVVVNGTEYFPIYAGKQYEGIFSIGDVLTLSRTGEKYVFSGYLDSMRWFGYVPISDPPRILEDYFVAPFCNADETDSMTQLSTTSGIYAVPKGDVATFEKLAIDIADEYDIKLRIMSVDEIIAQWNDRMSELMGRYKKLTCTVIACAISSIIALLVVSVHIKRRNLGIRIAYGSSKKSEICSLFVGILVQFAFALLIAYLLILNSIMQSRADELIDVYVATLNRISLPVVGVMAIVMASIVCVVPTILIERYEPAELIN